MAEPRGAQKELSLLALFSARIPGEGRDRAGEHYHQSPTERDGSAFPQTTAVCRKRSPSPSEGKNDPEVSGLHYPFSLTSPKAADLSLIKAQKKNTVF